MKKQAKKPAAKKGADKARRAKAVNLTAPDAEVTGQGLAQGRPSNPCSCLCGVRD